MRITAVFILLLIILQNAGCAFAELSDTIKKDFSSPEFKTYKSDKSNELNILDKKITEKETKLKRLLSDEKLTESQRKSKTSLLQKEINTLKTQKKNTEKI
ncbi:MAG: hypothetical protein LUE64_04300 [Candidatus Gastranaerophilales bacterium]|nr:hypothetical protein [Candidatus Gastranaerophilales bacterium]